MLLSLALRLECLLTALLENITLRKPVLMFFALGFWMTCHSNVGDVRVNLHFQYARPKIPRVAGTGHVFSPLSFPLAKQSKMCGIRGRAHSLSHCFGTLKLVRCPWYNLLQMCIIQQV